MVLHLEEDGLVFRISDHTPDVISQVLLERGWIEYDETKISKSYQSWNLWWKTQRFRKSEHDEIAPWQRLNHFPRTDAITRKDCLVRNLRRMSCVHGVPAFNFHPTSYILPNEYTKFVTDYTKEKQKTEKKNVYWICKPVDLSRGRGIFVFHDLKDLSYDCSVVVQQYIINPFLISGYKFDIRIYVCVPSFQPLTIYMYQEGIVRFSTDKFDLNQLNNVFSHLTNTSINKFGPSYSMDKERLGPGCKWTLSQLRSYLRQMDSVDEMLLWFRICNIITCTLATQAPSVPKCQNCFEVFGFDILIDDQMKPWLLEVNFSPALSMDCQADFIAKRSLINDLIDLLNFKVEDREHGGEAFRCRPSPCRSLKFNNSPKTLDSKSRNLAASKSLSSLSRKPTGVKRIPSSCPAHRSAHQKHEAGCRKSKSAIAKDQVSRNNLNTVNPTSLLSSRFKEDVCEVEAERSSSPAESFPRNSSSNSVASSISSVDHSNQPERLTDDAAEKEGGSMKMRPKLSKQVNSFDKRASSTKLVSTSISSKQQNSLSVRNQSSSVLSPIRSSSPKLSKKRSSNSAVDGRSIKSKSATSSDLGGVTRHNPRATTAYKSPYSIASTAPRKSGHSNNPWPRTRVGDFILTFPLSDAMRKASGSNFDMKVILREQQKILKKLSSLSSKEIHTSRSDSISFSSSDALHLSFQLKFDEEDRNPLYFWGPQNPPLLSQIIT